VDKIPLICS